MKRLLGIAAAVMAALALAAACGGGDGGNGGGSGNDDARELQQLREQVESNYDAAVLRQLLTSALAIAERNAGQPLGDEAFAFAQDALLAHYKGSEGLFADVVPVPSQATGDAYLAPFQNLAGFLMVVPEPFRPDEVVATFHADLLERADSNLFELEYARDNRLTWAADLQSAGTTELTWFGLGPLGASSAEEYGREAASLAYLRQLAVQAGETPDLLAGWDLLIGAVTLAGYAPPSLETGYEDGKFVTVYTAESVAGGAANAAELSAAIDAPGRTFRRSNSDVAGGPAPP